MYTGIKHWCQVGVNQTKSCLYLCRCIWLFYSKSPIIYFIQASELCPWTWWISHCHHWVVSGLKLLSHMTDEKKLGTTLSYYMQLKHFFRWTKTWKNEASYPVTVIRCWFLESFDPLNCAWCYLELLHVFPPSAGLHQQLEMHPSVPA